MRPHPLFDNHPVRTEVAASSSEPTPNTKGIAVMTGGYFCEASTSGTTEVHAATARGTLDGDLLCVDAPLGDEGGGAPLYWRS